MAPKFAYRFCGLRVESDLALPGLEIAASADREADVVVRYGSVPSDGMTDGNAAGSWCAEGNTIKLWVRGIATYSMVAGRTVWIDPVKGARERDLVLFLQGSGFGAIWHQRGMLALHASSVNTGDSCSAFAGTSGAGKSTMAAFLTRRGCSLVSDDVSVLAITDEGPAVWPGPARLKLWEDGLSRLGEDVSSLHHAGGRRRKFHLPVAQPDQPPGAGPVPLKALYLIEDGEGEPRLEDITGLDAINVIARHTYCPEYVSALGLEAQHFRLCVATAARITVRRLVRPRGFDHMDGVLQALDAEWRTSR
ncbi:MAG: hypothetical protein L0271_17130 [Gemmatimonadetes bacterium]|nr:hypothetical protein [Gemmatimonadota bacterium]